MKKLENGTKVLNINEIDGCDFYYICEQDGIKCINLNGWFYVNGDGWHFTGVRVDEMSVKDFMTHQACNSFGYDQTITQMIDNSKQYIDDFATQKDAEELLEEFGPTVLFLGDVNENTPEGIYVSPIKKEYDAEKEVGPSAMEVKVPGGTLRATKSTDPMYPGIDVEFIADAEDSSRGNFLSRPRVLVEYKIEDNELRAAIWADEKSEDYSDDVEFNKHYFK